MSRSNLGTIFYRQDCYGFPLTFDLTPGLNPTTKMLISFPALPVDTTAYLNTHLNDRHTHPLIYTHTLTHTHTHSHTRSHNTLSHTYTHSHTLTHKHTITHTQRSHTTHSHINSRAHSHTHTHTHTKISFMLSYVT